MVVVVWCARSVRAVSGQEAGAPGEGRGGGWGEKAAGRCMQGDGGRPMCTHACVLCSACAGTCAASPQCCQPAVLPAHRPNPPDELASIRHSPANIGCATAASSSRLHVWHSCGTQKGAGWRGCLCVWWWWWWWGAWEQPGVAMMGRHGSSTADSCRPTNGLQQPAALPLHQAPAKAPPPQPRLTRASARHAPICTAGGLPGASPATAACM